METKYIGIVDELEERKRFLQEELRKINRLLQVARGEEPITSPSRGINKVKPTGVKWQKEVLSIINKNDKPLTLDEVRDKFVENGFAEAGSFRGRSAINVGLIRLAKRGIIEKTEQGAYHKKIKEDS